MKKALSFLLVLFSIFSFAQAPAGYYDAAAGKTGYELKTALHNIIKDPNVDSYNGLWTDFQSTDVDRYYENDGTVLDIYSENPTGTDPYTYTYTSDQCGNYSGEGSCYNREHSFPKSWFNDASPMYSDLFHIYPTDGYVNNRRSSYPYGEVDNPTWTSMNGSKLGPCYVPGYTGTVFEPIDEFKGDLARTYFYMATCYEDRITSWSSPVLDGSSDKCYEDWFLNMLLQWHHNDPVSQKEIDRNNAIYQIQGNRNPFIDHPEYVDCIWANNCTEDTSGTGGSSSTTTTIVDQDFDNCDLTGWVLYQPSGSDGWQCSTQYGNIEANAYGASSPSDDWLITPQIDLTAYTSGKLNFDSYTKYTDNNIPHPAMHVYYSTDYSGSGDPANATWTELTGWNVPAENSAVSTNSGDIDLSSISQPFYIGFHYQSSGTAANECELWRLDNITITGTTTSTAITTTLPARTTLNVYPNPISNGQMTVKLQTAQTSSVEIRVINLSGKVLMDRRFYAQPQGTHYYFMSLPSSSKGVYILQVITKSQTLVKRIIVQ